MAYLVFNPRASARPGPISATASEADWIAPSVAPARESMRLACRQSPNRLSRTRWMPWNEICLLADMARPSRSEPEGENPNFSALATARGRRQCSCANAVGAILFVNIVPPPGFFHLIGRQIQMRGAMSRNPQKWHERLVFDGTRSDADERPALVSSCE